MASGRFDPRGARNKRLERIGKAKTLHPIRNRSYYGVAIYGNEKLSWFRVKWSVNRTR